MLSYENHLAMCESAAEERFCHVAIRGMLAAECVQQYRVGPYRIDFVVNGIGLEIDGKRFHDPARDYKRDMEIMSRDATVKCVCRIPAACVFYFPFAVQGALSAMFPGELGHMRTRAVQMQSLSAAECCEQSDRLINREDWEGFAWLHENEGYDTESGASLAGIGSPLCFCDVPNAAIPYLSNRALREIERPLVISVHQRLRSRQ